ncbi:MAG: sensor histidine kinase KdpD [Planctomycetes bacterium]|nr:sensor histidine kinase KdpD [Planctomycetota bacterium]
MESARPDPDRVLAEVQREERRAKRGRLKIHVGAAPGVGKTFAMLCAARRLSRQGRDLVLGWIETHGRAETEALLEGLERLPPRLLSYRGRELHEFDLDAALARRPEILLVDELAHTNAPGSRHAKRWQDVQELREAGIEVHTTLNVQHLESLNDLVEGTTGIPVQETVPDAIFDEADEIEVVDLAPDALLERLRAGKVYVPEAARTAIESFFRKRNLVALRELALRKTAQWVDRQLLELKREQGVRKSFGVAERILVCIGPSPSSAQVLRTAHRLARASRAELFALFVESPRALRGLGAVDRERVMQHLRLAETLGARTATVTSEDGVGAIFDFAKEHDIRRIVAGKTVLPRGLLRRRRGFLEALVHGTGDLELTLVHGFEEASRPAAADPVEADAEALPAARLAPWTAYSAAGLCELMALGAAFALYAPPDISAEAMLLLLGVVAASFFCGRGPSVFAALLGVVAFNFFFIEPRYTLTVDDPAYLVALVGMLLVGLSISTLIARSRDRADMAQAREREANVLASLVRDLAGAESPDEVARISVEHFRDCLSADFAFLIPEQGGVVSPAAILASSGAVDWLGTNELGVARWCFENGKAAGAGTSNLPGSAGHFVPLRSHRGAEGVLALRTRPEGALLRPSERMRLQTLVEQSALALERLALLEERQRSRREIEAEKLRSTLLASVSHDLRTPLATIFGAASGLLDEHLDPAAPSRRELAQVIVEESERLNDLIANLVFATRLESERIDARRDWLALEEVVGSAVRRAIPRLGERPLRVELAPHLPWIRGDAVLLEQALYNLIENCGRHTPLGTRVEVRGWSAGDQLLLEVRDDGPGIPALEAAQVFQRFVRGKGSAGMGLGLSIVRGIVEAHGGRAWLEPRSERGASFRIALPVPGDQPSAPREATTQIESSSASGVER